MEYLKMIVKCLSVCEAGGSGSEKLKKCPPPSFAVLWFVNGHDRKPRQKKTKKQQQKKQPKYAKKNKGLWCGLKILSL